MDVAKLVLIPILLSLLTLTLLTSNILYAQDAQDDTMTPEDNKAKQDIVEALSDAVNHNWAQYDMLNGSKKFDNSSFVIYNSSGETPEQPLVCGQGTHEENGVCVPDTQPECPAGKHLENGVCVPDTQPPGNITKIDFAGDLLGTDVINEMKGDYNVALGDLGYEKNLDTFKTNWEKLNNHRCVIGNHDSDEKEEGERIVQQAKEFCKDTWVEKVAGGTTLLFGVNTNANLDTQLETAEDTFMNSALMEGVKNVILLTHKPCEVHPESHHKPEANVKEFCQDFDSKIPQGIEKYHISGHNHEIAKSSNDRFFLSGGGGNEEHRKCDTNNRWDFCETESGYLEFEINNNTGEIKSNFKVIE